MTSYAGRAPFEIAQVAQSTFGVIGRNFATFLILSLVLAGAPNLIVQVINASLPSDATGLQLRSLVTLVGGLASLVCSALLLASVVTGAISDLNGRKASLGEMVSGATAFIPTLAGLAILQTLAVGLASVLLLVPGLILMTAWVVTTPAVIVDKSGVFEAFGRSAELTRGNRWAIFSLLLVYFIALAVVSFAGMTVFGGIRGLMAASTGFHPALIVYNTVLTVLVSMVSATGTAVIYYELRRVREGVAPRALVETFA